MFTDTSCIQHIFDGELIDSKDLKLKKYIFRDFSKK